MLTIALLTLSTADARPADYHKCSATNPHIGAFAYFTSSYACTCLKAKDTSSAWYGGVDMKLGSEERPDGTCFENDVWEASLPGYYPSIENKVAADIYHIAEAIGKDEGFAYYPSIFDLWGGGWTEARIVNMGEGEEISGPIDPNQFQYPWFIDLEELFAGGPYVMLDPDAEPWFYLHATSQVSHAVTTDNNDDGMTDVVVVFEDGDVWEIQGPVPQGEWIEPPMD